MTTYAERSRTPSRPVEVPRSVAVDATGKGASQGRPDAASEQQRTEQQRTIQREKTGNLSDAALRRGSERDWLDAAAKPPAAATDPHLVTRDDLFREIDYLRRYLVERDLIFDSALLLRFTRMRAIAATLLPEKIEWIRCGYGACRIRFRTEAERREHRRVVHWIDDAEECVA